MPIESFKYIIPRNEVLEIQRAGYRAYLAGESPKDNPYKRESDENIVRQGAWFRGFAASKTDRARANREAVSEKNSDTGSIDMTERQQ